MIGFFPTYYYLSSSWVFRLFFLELERVDKKFYLDVERIRKCLFFLNIGQVTTSELSSAW